MTRLLDACLDERIRAEIDALDGEASMVAALLEDALHHDAWAWPPRFHELSVRPRAASRDVKPRDAIRLALPLPSQEYSGSYFADSRFTAPLAAASG